MFHYCNVFQASFEDHDPLQDQCSIQAIVYLLEAISRSLVAGPGHVAISGHWGWVEAASVNQILDEAYQV